MIYNFTYNFAYKLCECGIIQYGSVYEHVILINKRNGDLKSLC